MLPSSPRLFRSAAAAVLDAVARRTAPPVVTDVRDAGLTTLPAAVLAELHQHVLEAERERVPGVLVVAGDKRGGAAVVVADGRTSSREVRVYGVADRPALAASLTAQGFRPDATRVSLLDGWPSADDPEPVAVAYLGRRAVGPALAPLAARLAPGGVVVVAAFGADERRAVEAVAQAHGLAVARKPRRLTLRWEA
ncbi:hypothetical protein [Rubrivirga sp. IMCC43871]|uniref:hypothetical protein n=1 Tax=Rubrivirga sp. IMCC43871 TaxID=3391575 RepID=UPI00398FA52D